MTDGFKSPTPSGGGHRNSRITSLVVTATFSRLLLNTARRFPYTFAPVLSRGLGVPLPAVTGLIAVNQITGFLGIFFGPLADRFGYRMMMLGGLCMLVAGMFAAGLMPFYGVVMVSLLLAGLGKNVFDPAIQAYVGQRVAFNRRGRVIGILEFCWAGSTLFGIPAVALLIDRYGWRSPFFAIGGLGLLGLLVLRHIFKQERPRVDSGSGRQQGVSATATEILRAWHLLLKNRAALCAICFIFFVSVSNDILFVVYGAWLEQSFGLSILALGVGTSVIGAAELTGEVLTATLADRLGLSRSVMIGLFLNILSYLLLPYVEQSLGLALAGLFAVFLTLEFTIVSALSLCTEIVPGARATMMSMFFASAGLGRVAGALIGGPVWMAGGILATGIASAVVAAFGLVMLIYGLRGWRPS